MVMRVPHVYGEVALVAERVAAFRRAPESERLTAIAVLTKRRVSHSGAFAATVAALIVAGLVGALAAYTAYIGLVAQVALAQRQAGVELAGFFREGGGTKEQVNAAHMLSRDALMLLSDTPELLPSALGAFGAATVMALIWAWWRTRRGATAEAWLAVYQAETVPAKSEAVAVAPSRRRVLWGLLRRKRSRMRIHWQTLCLSGRRGDGGGGVPPQGCEVGGQRRNAGCGSGSLGFGA